MVNASDLDIDQLKGMPDVTFDFGVSADVKSAFSAAASLLEGQRGTRASWRSSGSTDFKGYFSQVFQQNGTQQLLDLDEVAQALRDVVTKIGSVEQAAREENARRKTARDWAKSQADRNWLEKGWDDVFGGDDPPAVDISDKGPAQSAQQPAPKQRQTPAPGSGGGGAGTSSARPSDLRTFATNTRNGDDAFSGTAGRLQSQCDRFSTACSWATLDASGPINGLKQWLKLNGDDATWATTVADAFKAAGGEGNVSTLSNATIQAALRNAGVAVNRSDIQVDPAIAYGSPPTTGYADDPVNTASGNFIENEADLGFTGPAAALALTRTYNSLNSAIGGFGRGWSSWTEAGLSFTDQAARLQTADGRHIVFPRLGDRWDRADGANLWLARVEDDHGYLVTGSSGLRWRLAEDGRLISTSHGPGTKISFEYDAARRLVSMAHEFGRSISWQWDDASGMIGGAVSSDGRRVWYEYDDAGRLVAAHTPAGTRSYRWNDAGLMDAVIDPDGVVEAENSYDDQGRVITQRSPFGRVTRFVYLPGGVTSVTSVSDVDGERSNTWISDAKGRLIGVIDAHDHRQSTSYDRYGNPVMISERNGAVTVNSYDDRGRRTGQVLPSGARISWTYDDQDRPVTVTVTSTDDQGQTVEAVTRYRYDGESRDPSQVTDPEGGVTRLTWVDGLMKQVIDPEGVTVSFDHDQHGDLVAATDGDGNVARLERDALGRVTAAITPLGHRTSYRYAGQGPLASRQDPDGAVWRYEYSAGGRLTAVVNPLGDRAELEYGADHGQETRTVDPLGRAVTSSYDDLGNRVRAELPDGSRWEFGFDAMSRLRDTTDPSGGRWQLGYDDQGFVTRTIDPTGVERIVERDQDGRPTRVGDRLAQTGAGYDALGRTVTRTGADGSTAFFSYDLCGRLVERTDPTGATTRFRRDAAGRVVAVTHPMGTTYRYEYDACGRRSATIDTDGSRYEFQYDADSRLIREYWPTGEQAWVSYDECGRPTEHYEPGKGSTRFGYDKVGRTVRIVDGWHGSRRFRYDQAGQLVTVTNAAGGQTRFEYNRLGQCVAMIDPLGGRSERRFDPMGRVLSETDALGRTTRYGYDAAGRPTRRTDPTGNELSWTHDLTGRVSDTLAGDRVLSTVDRDFGGRSVRLRESQTINELVYDPNGRLIRRTRGRAPSPAGTGSGTGSDGAGLAGPIGLTWAYDGDGQRTAFTRTDGSQTRYEYDSAGRVAALTEPGLGRAVIDRDSIGRIVSMTGPGLHVSWTWDGGAISSQTVSRQGATQTTRIERDEAGRVSAQTVDDIRTSYGYDPAGQLIQIRRGDGSVTSYSYDAGGRMVQEITDGQPTTYAYDAAGQLISKITPAGRTSYRYDAAGQRTSEAGPAGERLFGWDPRGYLNRITTITHQGDKVVARTRELHIDALGELADVDGHTIAWDTASGLPALAQIGELSISNYGPLTALLPDAAGAAAGNGGWLTPDWRPRTSSGADPWGVSGTSETPELPSGVAIGGQANLLVDGMEWMQARVYDPASRGFLSTDPLAPELGTGWAGNPYAFAGNDPLNQSDPWGLKPVSDQELQAYRDSNNGALSDAWHATTSWVKNNWEYIAAGALIVGGIAVMCTGIGGPIGAAMIGGALMSGGISAGTQKFTTGSVDWGKVGVDAAIGGVAGLAGGGAAIGAMRATTGITSALGRNVLTGAAAGMADGGVSGGLSYAASGQPLTVDGFLNATSRGAIMGGATGGVAGGGLTAVSRMACFVAGTQVLMGDGSSKDIEDVEIGDEVTAADPETGETHARRVIDTYVHHDVPTYEVETTAGAVTSTEEHPFYVKGKGWIPVRELRPGDRLVDPKGSDVQVVAVHPTGQTATVFNLNVDDLHTYHVQTGDTWLLVHNKCAAQSADTLLSAGEGSARLPKHMGSVRRVAGKYEIPIDDLSIRISNKPLRAQGSTAPDQTVTLYDAAFDSEESLAKTLVHERVHVEDLRNGMPYPEDYDASSAAEVRAETIANAWWETF